MSRNERHRRSKRFTSLCAACQERKARFRYRGEVRADRDHTLCFECYRGEINSARVRRLAEAVTPPRMPSPFGHEQAEVLDERRLAHRRQMLEHLKRPSAVAS